MPPAFLGLGRLFGTSGSSAEQNFKTPSAADSSQYHFDDAHSPPALAHSRLRTGSSLDHHRYSLFSPRRHTDPAAYTETPSSPMRPQQPELPRRGARTSPENLTGFLPDYRTPRDAVPVSVHIPGSASTSSSTQRHKKPGASGEFVPRNTLSHTSPHKAPEYNAPRTYNGARSHFRGLQFGSTTGDNVRRQKTSPSFPDEDYLANPRKRQKISEPRSSSTHIVDLTDESPAEAKTSLVRRTSTQDSNIRDHFAQSAAPRSSGSAHSGVSGAFVLESFHNVDARMNPKDYAGPRRSSDSAAGLPANDSGPLVHATGSPEETKLRKKFILDELLDSIQGDANPNPSSAKKKLLGQKFAATSRKAALEVDELASDPLEGSSNQHGLPSGSQRKIGRNHNGTGAPTTSAPKSTHEKTHAGRSVTLIDDSEDELQLEVPRALPPKQRETTVRAMDAANSPYFDGASEADQSHRPSKRSPEYDTGAFKGDIKPSSFTSRKGAKSAQALSRWPESGIKRWRLKMFKMPRTGPVTGNNVWLVYYPEQKHFLLISDDHPVLIGPKMASVTNSLVNRMLYGNGESTKVFLTGPQVGSQDHYKRFLEFMDTKDRDSFVHFLRCSTPLRSLEKPGKHMDGIFARADLDPTWNPVSEVVDAGQEEAYLESRAHPHRQEAVERSGDKERAHDKGSTSASATTEKPHSKTKLISQMQSGSSRPETSTRTSRAVRVAEEALEMSNFQALGNARSTRSSNRAERPDKAVEYAERIENSPEPERQWPPIQFPEVAWKHPLVYPPTGRQRAQVEWEDLHKLRDGEFLNDSIIAFYMTWASKEAEQRGALSPNKVYWFNTYFYSTLTKTSRGQKGVNYEGVQRWTSKVDIFTYDYVVIPINEDQHWYLAIVCNLPALARKIESGKIVEEEGSKSEKKAVPKDSLAAQVHELLSDKQETPSEAPKEVGTFGDPMELDLPVRSDGQTGFEIPREQSIVEADALQRPLTPQPRSGRASRSPIQRDEDKEINLLRTGREDASKTSPGGKKGRRKPAAPLKKFDTDQPVIIMLDSLGLPHSKTSRNLKEYLVREGKSKRGLDIDTKDFQGMTAKEIPLQDNFCDCGVFVCLYFEKFINEPEAFAHKILRREMDAQKDWPDIQTPKTRRDIIALLTRLQQEQARERKEQKRKKQQGEKKQEDKTDTNGQGTTPVSKQSSPAKIELEPDSKSYKEAPPEELPEHRLDVCPSAPSLPTGSPEIQQQSSPPHLPARNHPRKTHSPKVIAPPPQYLDLEIPHPHHGTSRGPSPHLNGIPKLDLRVPSPINRKRKESSMDHVNHHTAAEHNSEEPIQSIEEMEGVEHSPVHDDDVMLYDENDAEVEKISDSQPQSQPDYLVHAREEHNAFCANLNAVTGSGGGGGAGGVQLETWKERSSSATASQRRRKKKKPEEEAEIIEIDDSQP